MKKILLVFGTRPEAIKMAPLVKALEKEVSIISKVCVTAQHREMLDQVLEIFDITPDYDLNLMMPDQDLYDITSNILLGMKKVLQEFKPDLLLVHGDTSTTLAAALAAFYQQIRIAHIEAGLRTHNLYSPWPEEANRQLTSVLANYHFVPTINNQKNLMNENKYLSNILITGNTVIDALLYTVNKQNESLSFQAELKQDLKQKGFMLDHTRKIILVTGHRRENFGQSLINICEALKTIALNNPDIDIVYPVHLNPNIQKTVHEILGSIENIYLLKPLQYTSFVYLMNQSYLIITDSGGIQEEAPSLGKPVLVTRDSTERTEALEASIVKLVGTDRNNIIKETQYLIDNKEVYSTINQTKNPYGDGTACKQIIDFIKINL